MYEDEALAYFKSKKKLNDVAKSENISRGRSLKVLTEFPLFSN